MTNMDLTVPLSVHQLEVTICDFKLGRRPPGNALCLYGTGVAMLSGILNSPCAVQVDIEIMRAFVRLQRMLAADEDLARRLNDLERKYDSPFKVVFDAIRQLMIPPIKSRRKIGFDR